MIALLVIGALLTVGVAGFVLGHERATALHEEAQYRAVEKERLAARDNAVQKATNAAEQERALDEFDEAAAADLLEGAGVKLERK